MPIVRKTPLHLWIVGIISLLWNSFGALDYTLSKLHNASYLAGFTPEQRDFFDSFPLWANVGWAFGVWGAVAGSLLLLMRSRHAVVAFILSLAGLAVSSLFQFGVAPVSVTTLFGTFPVYFTLMIAVIAVALLIYAQRQTASGVLR